MFWRRKTSVYVTCLIAWNISAIGSSPKFPHILRKTLICYFNKIIKEFSPVLCPEICATFFLAEIFHKSGYLAAESPPLKYSTDISGHGTPIGWNGWMLNGLHIRFEAEHIIACCCWNSSYQHSASCKFNSETINTSFACNAVWKIHEKVSGYRNSLCILYNKWLYIYALTTISLLDHNMLSRYMTMNVNVKAVRESFDSL